MRIGCEWASIGFCMRSTVIGSLFLLWTSDIEAKSIAAEHGYEFDGI